MEKIMLAVAVGIAVAGVPHIKRLSEPPMGWESIAFVMIWSASASAVVWRIFNAIVFPQ